MIRKLRIKFIVIIMSIMSLLIVSIFLTLNFTMFRVGNRQSSDMLKQIAENDGMIQGRLLIINDENISLGGFRPPELTRAVSPINQFSVKLDFDNQILDIISGDLEEYSEETIAKLCTRVLGKNKESGKISNLQFFIMEKNYGKIIVFSDHSNESNMNSRLLRISLSIGLPSLLVVFLISLLLSKWAIRPVEKAFTAQKQFVADASHELKTPLTVISANADVLASEIPDSKWLSFIKTETRRMSELVNNLLYLAKSDSSENIYNISEFNLSEAVMSAGLPFESVAFENRIDYQINIVGDIMMKGDESQLGQVIVILLDNALKNVNENGKVEVSLIAESGKKVITVLNSGDGINADIEKIFERFYRGDSSRARETGGYGLGLSIAKTIVEAHKGRISASSEKGKWAKFTVILP